MAEEGEESHDWRPWLGGWLFICTLFARCWEKDVYQRDRERTGQETVSRVGSASFDLQSSLGDK